MAVVERDREGATVAAGDPFARADAGAADASVRDAVGLKRRRDRPAELQLAAPPSISSPMGSARDSTGRCCSSPRLPGRRRGRGAATGAGCAQRHPRHRRRHPTADRTVRHRRGHRGVSQVRPASARDHQPRQPPARHRAASTPTPHRFARPRRRLHGRVNRLLPRARERAALVLLDRDPALRDAPARDLPLAS